MNDLTTTITDTLPSLLDRASQTLSAAMSSAEVLEARDFARVAYDAAKSAGRMAKAKKAHDDVIAAVYRAQADALLIEARAKMRLADEYDAAQERGEVAGHGGPRNFNVGEPYVETTASDIGLRRDEIQEARKLRDAETRNPGAAADALGEIVERGEEPTKASLLRAMTGEAPKPRHGLSGLTREALEDDVIGLRHALSEAESTINMQKAEIAKLKEKNAELMATDHGAIIGRLQKKLLAVEYTRDEALASAKRMEYRMKVSIKERDAAVKEREDQEIIL